MAEAAEMAAPSDAEAVAPSADAMACWCCGTSDVKYRCPRCERVTCSLKCCLVHKKEFDCNGKRDRTKYIPIKEFTDSSLSSDYFFLEEVSRSASTAARSKTQLNANARRYNVHRPSKKRRIIGSDAASMDQVNPHVTSDWLSRFPVASQLLVQHAGERGVSVTLLAPGMSKRARNSSYIDTKANKLYWRVEWVFPSAEVPVNLAEDRACDEATLFELLSAYLAQSPETVTIRAKLKKYAMRDWQQHIALLLRKEFTPASNVQYYQLDGTQSLARNLQRKCIVEFPIITVILASDLHEYAIAHDLIEVVASPDDTQAVAPPQLAANPIHVASTSTSPPLIESMEDIQQDQQHNLPSGGNP